MMKIEFYEWVYNFNNICFIDLRVLKEVTDRGHLEKGFYLYLEKKVKTPLIKYDTFQDIVKKYPKKSSCWCLSHKNYIDCHFYREKEQPISKNQILKSYKQKLNKKECLHHNVSACSKDIIGAHSISKNNSLKHISKDNHVYGTKIGFKELSFEKIGINQASTFSGFCKKHDDLLFASFEKKNFEKTSKQLFDLCYRAICIDHYQLLRIKDLYIDQKNYSDNSQDLIRQFEDQISLNSKIHFYNLGIKYSNYYKKKMEQSYTSPSHGEILQHYIFELEDGYPKFQSSSCFNLEFDLEAKRLQNLNEADTQSKNLFVNCLILNQKGYFILSWLSENEIFGRQIIHSIINNPNKISDKLFSFVFLYIQNTYVSPEWYEKLTLSQQDELEKLRQYWNEINKFHIGLITSNFNSIKVKNHYFFS